MIDENDFGSSDHIRDLTFKIGGVWRKLKNYETLILGYRCQRCGASFPAGTRGVKEPKQCPKCHNPQWKIPREKP